MGNFIKGKIAIGRMLAPRDTWATLDSPALAAVLDTIPAGQVAHDLAIEADRAAEITFVDCDSHGWQVPPTPEALTAWLNDIAPVPEACWTTHGHGMRLVYLGAHHEARAVAAAMAVPVAFKVELKRISRHPLSTRTDKPGLCGPVIYNATAPDAPFTFRLGGTLTPELRAQALNALELEDGQRYPHERCPLNPDMPQDGNDPVTVYGDNVYCWQCEAQGYSYRPHLKPGRYPLSAAVGMQVTDLDRLADNRVHWTHAALELRHLYPNLSDRILKRAYTLALRGKGGDTDPRIPGVFSPALDFVWSGVWLSANTSNVRRVDSDAASAAPYCQFVEDTKDGPAVRIDKARKSQFTLSVPVGYKPVRLYRGLDVKPDDKRTIPLAVKAGLKHAVKLLATPMAETEALAKLARAFPGINPTYLRGVIAAGLCAGRGAGRKPQLCADGPSGTGKNETVRLAASFLGDDALKVRLTAGDEELFRYMGTGLVEGRRFFLIDELAKTQSLFKRLGTLLQFSSTLTWRPLYGAPTTTDFDAALFYPSVNFPDFLKRSTEFCRRTRRVRLVLRVPEWGLTCGGDTVAWRDRTADNAHVANSILTHVYNRCYALDFHWENVADAIGLGRLDDDLDVPDPQRYQELYRHARGEFEPPAFIADESYARGYIDLGQGRALKLINQFLDTDEDDDKKARRICRANLEALPWNNILCFNEPPVRIQISAKNGKWGYRFVECNAHCLRGRERINADLPPVPDAQPLPIVPAPTPGAIGWAKLNEVAA